MFKLYKNTYDKNGVCIYRDDNGNEAFFKRTEEGFTTKLRFTDKSIKTSPLYVKIPVEDTNGTSLQIERPTDINPERINDIVSRYSLLINRWISMCYDLETMNRVKRANQSIAQNLSDLAIYEELTPILGQL